MADSSSMICQVPRVILLLTVGSTEALTCVFCSTEIQNVQISCPAL